MCAAARAAATNGASATATGWPLTWTDAAAAGPVGATVAGPEVGATATGPHAAVAAAVARASTARTRMSPPRSLCRCTVDAQDARSVAVPKLHSLRPPRDR